MPASSQTQLRSCVLRCGRSGFAVDYWGRNPCVGAVFLTHAHADHLCGLSEAWEPDGRTVYCSSVTKALLLRKFPGLATRRDVRIETLAPNASVVLRLPDRSSASTRTPKRQTTVAETLLPNDSMNDDVEGHENDELLTVTALDAGHCPGSVAFLFEGKCGRVFHTGDWRREDWCGKASTPFGYDTLTNQPRRPLNDEKRRASSTASTAALPRCLTRAPLDLVLLDNTYGDPSYVFPTRHEAASKVCGLIKQTLEKNENADVYVGVDSLGKEPLLAAIARAIGEPVRVTPERFHASIAALEAAKEGLDEVKRGDDDDDEESDGDPFLGAAPRGSLTCASTSSCRVFALPKQRVTREKLAAVAAHTGREIVGILPTGWAVANATATEAPNAFARAVASFCGEKNKNAASLSASTKARDDFTHAKSGAFVSETTESLPVVHAVPYSLHASYDELEALVRALRPRAVVGNTRAPRNRSPGAPTLDVAAHFKDLCFGGDDENAPFDASVSKGAFRHERLVSKRETETRNANGDVLARARRALAPRGHFVSHAFNAFDAFHKTDVVDVVDAPARRLRLKPRAATARSRDARARDEVDDAPIPSAVPAEATSFGKSPSRAKEKEKAIRAPNSPVAFASELAILTKTYVDAVSRLVRAFPKRARGFRRGADAPAERVERREGEGAPADAEDEETARKKKKRRHVPRWVADGVADARAARA
jgi:DNA cross-link repair 1B protein